MATVAASDILLRIRELLSEATAKRWRDSATFGLIQWYDDGCAKQHRIVMATAAERGMLPTVGHDYIRYFLKKTTSALVAGQQDYSLPSDFYRFVCRVEIGTAPDVAVAEPLALGDDWLARTTPHLGPTPARPRYSLIPSASAPMLRIYTYGHRTVPNSTEPYTFTYYRDVIRTGANNNVDVPDPYNEGPVAYAVAVALMKALGMQETAQGFLSKFNDAALSIISPLQAQAQEPGR